MSKKAPFKANKNGGSYQRAMRYQLKHTFSIEFFTSSGCSWIAWTLYEQSWRVNATQEEIFDKDTGPVLTFWQMCCGLKIVDRMICLRGGGTREMSCLAAGWKKTPVPGTLCPQLHIWSIFFGGPRFATISTCLQQKEDKPRFTNQKLFIFIFLNFLLCNSLGSFIFWSSLIF